MSNSIDIFSRKNLERAGISLAFAAVAALSQGPRCGLLVFLSVMHGTVLMEVIEKYRRDKAAKAGPAVLK